LGSFTAALESVATVNGPKCSVAVVRAEMSADDRVEFQTALDDPNIQHAAIERALLKLHDDGKLTSRVGQGSVARHRKRECACCRG